MTYTREPERQNRSVTLTPVSSTDLSPATKLRVQHYQLFKKDDLISIYNRAANLAHITRIVEDPVAFVITIGASLPTDWNGPLELAAGSDVFHALPSTLELSGELPPGATFEYLKVGDDPGNYVYLYKSTNDIDVEDPTTSPQDVFRIQSVDAPLVLGAQATVSDYQARILSSNDVICSGRIHGNSSATIMGQFYVTTQRNTYGPDNCNMGFRGDSGTGWHIYTSSHPDNPDYGDLTTVNFFCYDGSSGTGRFQIVDKLVYGKVTQMPAGVFGGTNMQYEFHGLSTTDTDIYLQMGDNTQKLDYFQMQVADAPLVIGPEVPLGMQYGWSWASSPDAMYFTGPAVVTNQVNFDTRSINLNKLPGTDCVLNVIEWDGTAGGGVNRNLRVWLRDSEPNMVSLDPTGVNTTLFYLSHMGTHNDALERMDVFNSLTARHNLVPRSTNVEMRIYTATATNLGSNCYMRFNSAAFRDYFQIATETIPLLIGASDPVATLAASGEVQFTDHVYFDQHVGLGGDNGVGTHVERGRIYADADAVKYEQTVDQGDVWFYGEWADNFNADAKYPGTIYFATGPGGRTHGTAYQFNTGNTAGNYITLVLQDSTLRDYCRIYASTSGDGAPLVIGSAPPVNTITPPAGSVITSSELHVQGGISTWLNATTMLGLAYNTTSQPNNPLGFDFGHHVDVAGAGSVNFNLTPGLTFSTSPMVVAQYSSATSSGGKTSPVIVENKTTTGFDYICEIGSEFDWMVIGFAVAV